MAESGLEADARRLNALLRPDGSVVVPARLTGWVRRLLEPALADIRRAGRGGSLAFDVLETLDALERSEVSVSGTIMPGQDKIMVSSECEASEVFMVSAHAAEQLGCTDRAIRRALQEGRLRGRKLGREWLISQHDLDEYRFGKRST